MKSIFKKISIPGLILIIIGLSVLGYLFVAKQLSRAQDNKVYNQYVEDQKKSDNTKPAQNNDEIIDPEIKLLLDKGYAKPEATTFTGSKVHPKAIARLIIPRLMNKPTLDGAAKPIPGREDLGIKNNDSSTGVYDVVLFDGKDNSDTLRTTIGLMPETKLPSGLNNTAIIGHRSHPWGAHFRWLDQMQVNDEIILETLKYKYTYKVFKNFIIEPDDVWVMDDIPEKSIITLITCHPYNTSDKRLIVQGELIKANGN